MLKKGVCNNFGNGTCRFGNNCKFLHEQPKRQEEPVSDDRVRYLQQLHLQFEKKCQNCQNHRQLVLLSCGCECYCWECAKDRKQCFLKHEVTGFIR